MYNILKSCTTARSCRFNTKHGEKICYFPFIFDVSKIAAAVYNLYKIHQWVSSAQNVDSRTLYTSFHLGQGSTLELQKHCDRSYTEVTLQYCIATLRDF